MKADLVQIAVRVPLEFKAAIVAEAERRYLKESDVVREALREYITNHQINPPVKEQVAA